MAPEIDEAWIEQATDHYRRLDALRAELTRRIAVTDVKIRSGDGLVEIVVTADGAFQDVRISEEAMGARSADELSRTVLAACQEAGRAADWAREKLSEQLRSGLPGLPE